MMSEEQLTVDKLIDMLKKYNPNLPILVEGCDGCIDNPMIGLQVVNLGKYGWENVETDSLLIKQSSLQHRVGD